MGNTRVDKPFVEKPASGENHNICIYYPHTVGGGMKRLFRKARGRTPRRTPRISLPLAPLPRKAGTPRGVRRAS